MACSWKKQREINLNGTFKDGNPNFSNSTLKWLRQFGLDV